MAIANGDKNPQTMSGNNGEQFLKSRGLIVPMTLAMSGVKTSVNSTNTSGDATFTPLASVTIPGGIMGPNGMIMVRAAFTVTNSANTKTLRVAFGGANYFFSLGVTTSATASLQFPIYNRNSYTSQVGGSSTSTPGVSGGSTGTLLTTNIDTNQDQVLQIGGNWGSAIASEIISLENYQVEIIPGF